MWNAISQSARKLGDKGADEAKKVKNKAVREIRFGQTLVLLLLNRASFSPYKFPNDAFSSLVAGKRICC